MNGAWSNEQLCSTEMGEMDFFFLMSNDEVLWTETLSFDKNIIG